MKIEVAGHHSDYLNGNKLVTRIEITDGPGIFEDGTPLVLAYEHELWKEMAKQAALMLSSMIGANQHKMTKETIHEALQLKHCILNETPQEIEWVVAAARKAIGMDDKEDDS